MLELQGNTAAGGRGVGAGPATCASSGGGDGVAAAAHAVPATRQTRGGSHLTATGSGFFSPPGGAHAGVRTQWVGVSAFAPRGTRTTVGDVRRRTGGRPRIAPQRPKTVPVGGSGRIVLLTVSAIGAWCCASDCTVHRAVAAAELSAEVCGSLRPARVRPKNGNQTRGSVGSGHEEVLQRSSSPFCEELSWAADVAARFSRDPAASRQDWAIERASPSSPLAIEKAARASIPTAPEQATAPTSSRPYSTTAPASGVGRRTKGICGLEKEAAIYDFVE